MILDEPTSVLTPDEADSVLGMLRDMTRRGELSVLMITHKFREVTRFCDEVTVLRKGRFAGAGRVSDLTTAQMAEMMVGAEPPSASVARDSTEAGQVVLKIDRLEADDDLGLPILNGINLEVRCGEIVLRRPRVRVRVLWWRRRGLGGHATPPRQRRQSSQQLQ